MMTWFRLTLVCGALLGLLLGLTRPADWNDPSPAVRLGPCFDRGNEATSDPPTASVVASLESDPVRAGPFQFLVLDCTLSASKTGPRGQETHGLPDPMGPWRVADQPATQNQRPRANFCTKLLAFNRRIEESGFRNTL